MFLQYLWALKILAALTGTTMLQPLVMMCLVKWRNVMDLIQTWCNQNQQAEIVQMKYNLSRLNYLNCQTLSHPFKPSLQTLNHPQSDMSSLI